MYCLSHGFFIFSSNGIGNNDVCSNKDNGAVADTSETPKTDKDGFMEAPDGEIPFD